MRLFGNKLLETFCVVVECGGFTEAQYQLGITQSAVSCRIRDLERSLGYRLCERGRSGFCLTERGQVAYRKAREILCRLGDFDAELMALRGVVTGELRLGVVDNISSFSELPVVAALQDFMARENSVDLEMRVLSPSALEQELLSGTLHVAIGPVQNFRPEIEYHKLAEEQHGLYCGRLHPLYDSDPAIDCSELAADYRLCRRSYDVGAVVDRQLGAARVSNMEAMAMLVLSGHFLGALPCHAARPWVERGELKRLTARRYDTVSNFYLSTRKASVQRRATELFVADLLALAAG